MPNVKELSPILVLFIACILVAVGVATHRWATWSLKADVQVVSTGVERHRGLFKQCGGLGFNVQAKSASGGGCVAVDDHKAPKTFVVGGLVGGGLVAVAMTLYLFVKNSDSSYKIMPKVCGIAGVVAAVAILVGSVLFAIDEFGDHVSPGYSFFMTSVGALILIAGSVMSLTA